MSLTEAFGLLILLFGLTAAMEIFVIGRNGQERYSWDAAILHTTGVFIITGDIGVTVGYVLTLAVVDHVFYNASIAVQRGAN